MQILLDFAESSGLKWKEDFYKRISTNHLLWEPFELIHEYPHCQVYNVVQRKKNEKKNKQIAVKILNSSALNLEDFQSNILTLRQEIFCFVYLRTIFANMPIIV